MCISVSMFYGRSFWGFDDSNVEFFKHVIQNYWSKFSRVEVTYSRQLVPLLNHICINKINVGVALRESVMFKLNISLMSRLMQAILTSADGGDKRGWTTLKMVHS
jgi:hypothetical protein